MVFLLAAIATSIAFATFGVAVGQLVSRLQLPSSTAVIVTWLIIVAWAIAVTLLFKGNPHWIVSTLFVTGLGLFVPVSVWWYRGFYRHCDYVVG